MAVAVQGFQVTLLVVVVVTIPVMHFHEVAWHEVEATEGAFPLLASDQHS